MSWLRRLLGSDIQAPDAVHDPSDQAVLAGVVPLWQAPMIVEGLAERHIKATFAENSSGRMMIGGPPSARVMVLEADQEAAECFIDEMTDVDP